MIFDNDEKIDILCEFIQYKWEEFNEYIKEYFPNVVSENTIEEIENLLENLYEK